MILGVIADDFTGATDVASMLVRGGMRVTLVIGVPAQASWPEADAVVVALKSRTAPVSEAVQDSLAALTWLRAGGCRQIYFKVCSTFDSSSAGNIGPVADALSHATRAAITAVCPALPENGRTVYAGHLFVGSQLLSESSMREHPLTPMTDSNLVRVLGAQTTRGVGHVPHAHVAEGPGRLRVALSELRSQGLAYAIVDAIAQADLHTIAQATCGDPLVVAGSGVALALPAAYAAKGCFTPDHRKATSLHPVRGSAAVLSGSCSAATQAQVRAWCDSGHPALQIDACDLAAGWPVVDDAVRWAAGHLPSRAVLIHATAQPEIVKRVQQALGVERAGELVEQCLAAIAARLVDQGVQRLVVAGGETSGAVVSALGVRQLRVGPTIAPGVPWTQAIGRHLHLALKSGNFGGIGFFREALEMSADAHQVLP